MADGNLLTWMGAIGAVAQVVVAVVALYLAYRANRLNKDSLFLQRILSDLLEIVPMARRVKRLYVRMFDTFETLDAKIAARSEWLKAREEVDERLYEIQSMFPEATAAKDAWEKVASTEDSHAMSDALENSDNSGAVEEYERKHEVFVKEVGARVKTLRQ